MKRKKERLFDLTSTGELCLDFINTIDWRASKNSVELLNSHEDLIRWALHLELVDKQAADHLANEANRQSNKAYKELKHILDFRETLFRIFSSVTNKQIPELPDIEYLNRTLSKALSHLHLMFENREFDWKWSESDGIFDEVIWKIAQSASVLLTSNRIKQLRGCAGTDCTWLFLDTSRNKSRRWCMMGICGNRTKARRHYEQSKKR